VPSERIGGHGRCPRCGEPVAIRPAPESARPATAAAPSAGRSVASTLASLAFRPASPPRTPPRDLPEEFGRFRIHGQLGRGGMGSVYKAFDSVLHRQVALKIPHLGPEDGPETLERFYREARAAAAFDHPNLCPVYAVDHVDGVPYLTMPLLTGPPLSRCFEGRHPLPQRPVAALVRMLALAMEEAHRRGVVHRDLKPSNIIGDRQRVLAIVDFGLSLRSGWLDLERKGAMPLEDGDRLTIAGAVLGTPAYMAPEQVSGVTEAMGPACDIYSLGVIMYELLTGRLPFEGPAAVVLGLIKVSEPLRPSTLRPDLSASLEAICLKAMAKRPDERYDSMAELAASLKVFLGQGRAAEAGGVPAAVRRTPLPDHDAPTSAERHLVAQLLAGGERRSDGAGNEPSRVPAGFGRLLSGALDRRAFRSGPIGRLLHASPADWPSRIPRRLVIILALAGACGWLYGMVKALQLISGPRSAAKARRRPPRR
jgi:Protein kinase domain